MKINPIQIKTSNSEIGWMLGSPQNIFDKVYRYFLFVCWTVISPLVILAILIYYIIDVTVSTISADSNLKLILSKIHQCISVGIVKREHG